MSGVFAQFTHIKHIFVFGNLQFKLEFDYKVQFNQYSAAQYVLFPTGTGVIF